MNINENVSFAAPDNQKKSLLIGNGYLGANFFGGIEKERIVFSENSFQNNTDDFGFIGNLCDVLLTFSNINPDNIKNYNQSINKDKNYYFCSFEYEGAFHKREILALSSTPVACMKISSSKPRRICLRLSLDELQNRGEIKVNDNRMDYMRLSDENKTDYRYSFLVKKNGGELICSRDSIMVEHADDVTIYFTVSTECSDESTLHKKDITEDVLCKYTDIDFEKLFQN